MSVTIPIDVDDSALKATVAEDQALIDAQHEEWLRRRREMIKGLNTLNQAMGLVTQTLALTARVAGQTVNVILSSLLTAIQSSVSALLAISAGYFSTGILAPLGAIVAGFAAGLQAGVAIRVFQTEAELSTRFADIEATIKGLELQRGAIRVRGGGVTG